MAQETYASPGIASETYDALGRMHLHIDGARSYPRVLEVVQALEKRGNPGRFDEVLSSVSGPQRGLLPETYESHTPTIDGKEAFDFFSTSLMKDRADAINAVNVVSHMLSDADGAIVELEQVVGLIDPAGRERWIPEKRHARPILPGEASPVPSPSLKFEVHHGFEVSGELARKISLEILRDRCTKAGIMFGGWFVFENEGKQSFWSNAFTDTTGDTLQTFVSRERALLKGLLRDIGLEKISLQTLVERVVGIWHVGSSEGNR